MKWSETSTTFAGSKTLPAPIFSICRKATGPETSFAITRSQETMTTSPGVTSSASVWASSIFSASVRGTDLLQVLEGLPHGDHVPVLGVHVIEVRLVGVGVTITHSLTRHDRAEAILQRVYDRRPYAAGGR